MDALKMLTGMAADDGHLDVLDVQALGLGDKGVGTDHIQGGNANDLGGIVLAVLLVHLGGNGDSAVYRV